MPELMPPVWLLHASVASVWFYEGLWCKLLGGQPKELEVVRAVPTLGPRIGAQFLTLLGVVEVAVALWVLIGVAPFYCAVTQTVLLISLNMSGILWARDQIHDPAGMVIKNFAFLVLAWVAASQAVTA